MRKRIFTWLLLAAIVWFLVSAKVQAGLFGSAGKSGKSGDFNKGKLLLTVDFEPNVPLKYNFICERQISVNLGQSGKDSKGGKNRGSSRETTERLDMEIVYKPIKIDPYGYSTIEATCNSVKAARTSMGKREQGSNDAVEFLAGKSFILEITPAGKIADYNSLGSLIKEVGEKAFSSSQGKGRIKDPDMIMDFVATQWNMWDSISTIKEPLKGLKKGRKWNSRRLAPMPFVSKIGRDVEYQFKGITEANGVSLAEITSSYNLSPKSPAGVPVPYSGSFQMRGTFGFLSGYQMLFIKGTGRQLYDIKRGLIKSDTQQYQAKASASIFSLAGADIIIDQTITMTLIEQNNLSGDSIEQK
jgi:hypothetical protein